MQGREDPKESFQVKKIASWVFFLALALAMPVLAQPTLTASPNPLPAGTTTVTISWNAPGHTVVDVDIISSVRTVFASGGPTGSQPWPYAAPGQVFYLVDANTNDTLATLTLTSSATITLTPPAWSSGLSSVTLNWNAPGYTSVDIHTGSATGPPFETPGLPSTGSATVTGASVVPGLSFYLVDHATSTFLASVSLLGDWDIPLINPVTSQSAQSACLPFPVFNQPATAGPVGWATCLRVGYLHWYTIGDGWTTGFTLTNPTSSDLAISITVEDTTGIPSTLETSPTPCPSAQMNGASIPLDSNCSAAAILPARGALRFVFPSATGSSYVDGQILVQAEGKDGPSLSTIQVVEDYTYTDPSDVLYSTVTVPISWVDQATTTYSAFFEQSTSDNNSSGGFAVKDMSGAANSLDMKVFDVNGNLLSEKTQSLAANQTWANNAGPEFGASTFTSLPAVPIVRIQFTGTGNIAVLVLQYRGQSVSTIPAQPVTAP
jgi:hypothetical protein